MLLLLLAAPLVAPAWADEGSSGEGGAGDEDPLSPYRAPFGVLVESSIGSTSRPVEFDWRRTTAMVAATGDFLFELNNFNSGRAGALARIPSSGLIYEIGVSHVWVGDTRSSELLALTPYRQPGRPDRWELDFDVGVPLAEGVVTARPRIVPSVEMVLNGYLGLRYSFYPRSFEGMKAREVTGALLSPILTDAEIANLEERRLDGMQVDPGRYTVMMGLGNDLYFKQGLLVSPRLMFAVPVLAPVSETELLFWADLSLVIGVAF